LQRACPVDCGPAIGPSIRSSESLGGRRVLEPFPAPGAAISGAGQRHVVEGALAAREELLRLEIDALALQPKHATQTCLAMSPATLWRCILRWLQAAGEGCAWLPAAFASLLSKA